jgi:membrane AbrB-like protein
MPGGLNEMLLMGVAAGGEEKRIATAHATRILASVVFVVLFFGLFMGVSSGRSGQTGVPLDALSIMDWLILGGCALLGVRLALLIRLPAAPILGPMLLSGAAHIGGLVTVAPPTLLVVVAQVVIGTIIGGRFVGATLGGVGRDIALGVGSSLTMIAVAVLFAWIVSAVSATELSHSFLAYSPGGLTEMSLLALAMDQEVAYVSMMHIARISLVVLAAAPVLRWLSRWRRAPL